MHDRKFHKFEIPAPQRHFFLATLVLVLVSTLTGCATSDSGDILPTTPENVAALLVPPCESESIFTIRIDGSELTSPVTTQIAEEFMIQHPNICVIAESNGSDIGFRRLCEGEIHMNEASLGPDLFQYEECDQQAVEWVELPVARAGFGIYASSQNSFLDCVTAEQIHRIWDGPDIAHEWDELDSEWPDDEIHRYAQFNDRCVPVFFDDPFYAEVQRLDYFDPGEVYALAVDPIGIGIFSTVYYAHNKELLRQVGLFGDEACPFVTPLTVEPGHTPVWGQPFTIYVDRGALGIHPVIGEFLDFYMRRAPDLLPEEGFFVLSPDDYQDNLRLIAGGE